MEECVNMMSKIYFDCQFFSIMMDFSAFTSVSKIYCYLLDDDGSTNEFGDFYLKEFILILNDDVFVSSFFVVSCNSVCHFQL